MSQPERRAVPVLSVMDMVPVSAGCSRTDALTDMIALARAADAAGYERYWLAEHHGSTTYLSSATIVLMGQVLAATERLGVASGGIMLPNHAPLVVAEQIGTLATLYPGRVDLGLGRAPGTDRRTAAALRRRASEPGRFAEEILEILAYLGDEPVPERVPGSLLLGAPGVLDDAVQVSEPDGPRVRAIPGEGTHPNVWVLGSSVNGARVAGRLGLPFAVASHFAPVQAEAAIATLQDPDRYGRAFQIRIMVCDGEGSMLADVWSAPADDRPRPTTAGRTGISHTHSADFDTDEDFPPEPRHTR